MPVILPGLRSVLLLPRLAPMNSMDSTQAPAHSAKTPLRPLSEGNRLQRAYARWAAPHYARLSPELAIEGERIDRWLYSRRALGFWLGLACALLATAAGLRHTGLPLAMALVASLVLWLVLASYVLKAWLQPEKYSGRRCSCRWPVWAGSAAS